MFCVAVFVANDASKDFNEKICAQILARGSVSFFMRKKFFIDDCLEICGYFANAAAGASRLENS